MAKKNKKRKRKHTNPQAPARRSSADKKATSPSGNPRRVPDHVADHVAEVVEERIEHFSGPLPHPETLARYDQIVPGSAETIISVFKSQSEHRQRLEHLVIAGNARRSDRGLVMGFVMVLVVLAVGLGLVLLGESGPGTVVLSVPLPALAAVFVYGKRSQRKERETKASTGM